MKMGHEIASVITQNDILESCLWDAPPGLNPNEVAKANTEKDRMHGFIRLNELMVKRCIALQTEAASSSWLRPWVKPVPLMKNEREVWFSLAKHVDLSGSQEDLEKLQKALIKAIPKGMLKENLSTKRNETHSKHTVPRDPRQSTESFNLSMASFNAKIENMGKQFAGSALKSTSEAFAAIPFEDNSDPLCDIAMQQNYQEALNKLGFRKDMSEQCKCIWEQALKTLGVRFKTSQTENTITWVSRLLSKPSASVDITGG